MSNEAPVRALRLSRVLALALSLLTRRPGAALLVGALTIYLPSLAAEYFWPAPLVLSWDIVRWAAGMVPVTSIFAVFYAWIAVQAMPEDGATARRASVYSYAVPSVFAALVVGVVQLGGFALIIPGVLWSLACTVVIPAVACERLGALDAIRRSFDLTEDHWWAIFLFSTAVAIPINIVMTVLEYAVVGWESQQVDHSALVRLGVRPVANSVNAIIGGALSAAFYQEFTKLRA